MTTTALPTTITENELTSLLARLSSKPSVDSLLVLARDTGAIIRSTGPLSRSTNTTSQEYAAAVYKYVQASEELAGTLEGIDGGVMGGVVVEKERREPGTEEETVRDDVRLLRFRTRRRELVVVPDARFILVVFIDTPAAP